MWHAQWLGLFQSHWMAWAWVWFACRFTTLIIGGRNQQLHILVWSVVWNMFFAHILMYFICIYGIQPQLIHIFQRGRSATKQIYTAAGLESRLIWEASKFLGSKRGWESGEIRLTLLEFNGGLIQFDGCFVMMVSWDFIGYTLWLCQNSYWRLPEKEWVFPTKHDGFSIVMLVDLSLSLSIKVVFFL